MKAMIFAAGLGTRLRPITDTIPKALVRVNDKPLLDIVAERLIAAGAGSLVINAHHFADQIANHIAQCASYGVRCDLSVEYGEPLETGGGILRAKPFLEGCGSFLVHNVDILSNLDLRAFAGATRADAVATLHVSQRKTSRYLLFDKDMRLHGWINEKTGEVRSPFGEIDPSDYQRFAFSGIHHISDAIFDIMEDGNWPERFPIIDFYLKIAAEYPVYGIATDGFRMMDVGKIESLSEASSFLDSLK